MNTSIKSVPLLNISLAILSAVLIFFIPQFSIIFLLVLLVNLGVTLLGCKTFSPDLLHTNRILVGLLFIFSSFMKGIDPLGTKYKMLDYFAVYGIEWLGNLAFLMAIAMIAAEFIVGFCLTINVLPRWGVLGATLLMGFFTLTTFLDAAFELVADCGCFGEAIKMSNWQTFYKNLVIDAVLIPLIFNNKMLKNKMFNMPTQWMISIIAVCAFGLFQLYNYYFLPSVDLLKWRIGTELNQQVGETKIYLTYRNDRTGETREYLSPNYPWNDSVWMSEWSFVSQRSEGKDNYIGFTATALDGSDYTDDLISSPNVFLFVSPYLDKVTEAEFANIIRLQEELDKTSAYYVWVTATDEETIAGLQHNGLMRDDVEVLLGDDLELKTIVRSNPGLIWLDNGRVMGKWGRIDMEHSRKLERVINQLTEN